MRVHGTRSDVTFLLVLLVLSLGFNVYLAHRAFRRPETVPGAMPQSLVEPGTKLPPLELKTLAGQAAAVDYPQPGPTVLYFFSPQCPWCGRNLDNVRRLEAEIRGKYRFIGVSIDTAGLESYLSAHGLDFPVYCEPSERSSSVYGLTGVPQTMVVSAEGELIENWSGAYGEQLQPVVERFFDVELPGLTEEAEET